MQANEHFFNQIDKFKKHQKMAKKIRSIGEFLFEISKNLSAENASI